MSGRFQATAVDSSARRSAASLLRQFAQGEITNDALEQTWPQSRDPAAREVFDAVSGLWDDLYEHRYQRSAEGGELLERCADFLEGDAPYEWPTPNPILQLIALPISLVTFGFANRILWRKYRFPAHWPFATEEERARAKRIGG